MLVKVERLALTGSVAKIVPRVSKSVATNVSMPNPTVFTAGVVEKHVPKMKCVRVVCARGVAERDKRYATKPVSISNPILPTAESVTPIAATPGFALTAPAGMDAVAA